MLLELMNAMARSTIVPRASMIVLPTRPARTLKVATLVHARQASLATAKSVQMLMSAAAKTIVLPTRPARIRKVATLVHARQASLATAKSVQMLMSAAAKTIVLP